MCQKKDILILKKNRDHRGFFYIYWAIPISDFNIGAIIYSSLFSHSSGYSLQSFLPDHKTLKKGFPLLPGSHSAIESIFSFQEQTS